MLQDPLFTRWIHTMIQCSKLWSYKYWLPASSLTSLLMLLTILLLDIQWITQMTNLYTYWKYVLWFHCLHDYPVFMISPFSCLHCFHDFTVFLFTWFHYFHDFSVYMITLFSYLDDFTVFMIFLFTRLHCFHAHPVYKILMMITLFHVSIVHLISHRRYQRRYTFIYWRCLYIGCM